MKIGFIGCVESSAKALQQLIAMADENIQVAAVVTKQKSVFNADHVDLAPICESTGISYQYFDSANDTSVDFFSQFDVDVIYCFGWSHLLKTPLLTLPPKGVIGFHPAALPQNRGRHPIIWALALGLEETASSFFVMDEGADSGPIISQQMLPVDYHDNASSLYDKIMDLALQQIREFTLALRDNRETLVIQDASRVTYWRKRGRIDGTIDWRMSSRSIYNLVRALSKPYPGAEFVFQQNYFGVERATEHGTAIEANLEPGKVLQIDGNRMLVKCGAESAIWLEEHTFDVTAVKEGDYL